MTKLDKGLVMFGACVSGSHVALPKLTSNFSPKHSFPNMAPVNLT